MKPERSHTHGGQEVGEWGGAPDGSAGSGEDFSMFDEFLTYNWGQTCLGSCRWHRLGTVSGLQLSLGPEIAWRSSGDSLRAEGWSAGGLTSEGGRSRKIGMEWDGLGQVGFGRNQGPRAA